MSKTLAREQQFDSQRRSRLEPSPETNKEPLAPETPSAVAVETLQPVVAPVEQPQPANPAPDLAIEDAGSRPAIRWGPILHISILLFAFLAFLPYLLQPMIQKLARHDEQEQPSKQIAPVITKAGPVPVPAPSKAVPVAKREPAALAPSKQTLSTRLLPPTLRFMAVGAIHEPKKAEDIPPSVLPSSLWPINVSSPLNLVPSHSFIRWESAGVLPQKIPSQPLVAPENPPAPAATTARPKPAGAVNSSTDLAGIGSTLRTLKLMDTAIANAERVAKSENKKPGD